MLEKRVIILQGTFKMTRQTDMRSTHITFVIDRSIVVDVLGIPGLDGHVLTAIAKQNGPLQKPHKWKTMLMSLNDLKLSGQLKNHPCCLVYNSSDHLINPLKHFNKNDKK